MGSGTIRFWLLTFIIIAPAGRILGTDSPKVPTNVAYVSEEDGGISVIDLGTQKVIGRAGPSDLAPRGIAVTFDGKYVITSNKNTSDGAVFSTPDLSLLRRIHIGPSPEFIKINPSGDRLFATFEPSSEGGPPGAPQTKNDSDDGPNRVDPRSTWKREGRPRCKHSDQPQEVWNHLERGRWSRAGLQSQMRSQSVSIWS